jgi:hypothetical protein
LKHGVQAAADRLLITVTLAAVRADIQKQHLQRQQLEKY